MAALPTAPYMGNTTFWFSTTEMAELANKDPAFYNANLASRIKAANYFTITLPIYTAVGNTTGYSMIYTARFPFTAFYAEVGCEAAAGSTAVGFLQKALAADTGTYSTLTTSASTDIKGAAGTLQGVTIDSAKADIAYGDVIRFAITGASGGNATGGIAIIHCARL